jgi:hypothetical protein
MTARTEDMVSIPRAELDALRAENRRLRCAAGDVEALRRTHLTDRVTRRLPGRSGAAKNQICTSAGLIHAKPASAPNGGSWVPHRLCRHRP